MIDNFKDFIALNESSGSSYYDQFEDAIETPTDGIYDGIICSGNLVLNGKRFRLHCGPMACFKGPFRVEDGIVYMMPGTEQSLGSNHFRILIKDKENGDRIANICSVDENGIWGVDPMKRGDV